MLIIIHAVIIIISNTTLSVCEYNPYGFNAKSNDSHVSVYSHYYNPCGGPPLSPQSPPLSSPLSSPLYLGHLSDGHDTVQSFLQSLIVLLLWPGSKRRQEPGINRTTGGKQAVNISFEWSLVMEENNNITHQNTCHHVCVCKMYNVSLFLYITLIFEKHSIREDFKRLCRAPRIQNQIPEVKNSK